MIRYYKTIDGYFAVTDVSPTGFEGIVFVGRGGPINNISEQLYSADKLVNEVRVEDVPADWCNALGYNKVEDFPLLDESGDLMDFLPSRPAAKRKPPKKESERNYSMYIVLAAVIIAGVYFVCCL